MLIRAAPSTSRLRLGDAVPGMNQGARLVAGAPVSALKSGRSRQLRGHELVYQRVVGREVLECIPPSRLSERGGARRR
jgi:hypothetical protein